MFGTLFMNFNTPIYQVIEEFTGLTFKFTLSQLNNRTNSTE